MADEDTTPDPAEGARRRKRQAPTIDLKATDVSPQPDPAAQADEATEPPTQGREERSQDGGAEMQPEKHAAPEWLAVRPMLIGGLAGGALVAIVMAAVWFAGVVPARVAESGGADPAAIAALNARLTRAEAAIASMPAGDKTIPDRLTAADNAMKSLGIALSALNKRSDEVAATAADARARAEQADKTTTDLRNVVQGLTQNTSGGSSPAELESVQKRLAALEETTKAGPVDRQARLALIGVSLRDAVARGVPFAAEVGEMKTLGAGEKQVAALAPFAAGGVPTTAALLQELNGLLPAILKASGTQTPPAGFMERLQANAEKLVRIRPVNAPAGDEAAAVLARLEIDVAHADINGALADLGKLDERMRQPAQDWISRARARQAAVAAADELVAVSARSLGKK